MARVGLEKITWSSPVTEVLKLFFFSLLSQFSLLLSLSLSFSLPLLRSASADTERDADVPCASIANRVLTHREREREREREKERERERRETHSERRCYASSVVGRRRHLLPSAPAPAPAGRRRRGERQAHPLDVRCRLCERAHPRGRGEVRKTEERLHLNSTSF